MPCSRYFSIHRRACLFVLLAWAPSVLYLAGETLVKLPPYGPSTIMPYPQPPPIRLSALSGWIFIKLPRFEYEPITASPNGIVLLRDPLVDKFSRWKAGVTLPLGPESNQARTEGISDSAANQGVHTFRNYAMSATGSIALSYVYSSPSPESNFWTTSQNESMPMSGVWDEYIRVWSSLDDSARITQGYRYSGRIHVGLGSSGLYSAKYSRESKLVAINTDQSSGFDYVSGLFSMTGYAYRTDYFYFRILAKTPPYTTVGIENSYGAYYFLTALNSRGQAIGGIWFDGEIITGLVEGQSVPFSPLFISENGVVLGRNGLDAIVENRFGATTFAPLRSDEAADVMYSIASGYIPLPIDGRVTWVDELDRPNGFAPDGTPVVWTPKRNAQGIPSPSLGYDREAYVPLPLPDSWTTSPVHMIPPNTIKHQLGILSKDSQIQPFLAIRGGLLVDANRDGTIAFDGSDATSPSKPHKFWFNDDNDAGDMGGDDIPGRVAGANYADAVVNGTRDLVDFFPVFFDLKQLLTVLPHTAPGVKYKLKQADSALNFVYTNLTRELMTTRDGAFAYQTKIFGSGFGPDFTQAAGAATAQRITASGIELSSAYLTGVKDIDGGVLLIEGRMATAAPLVLYVEKDGISIAEVKLELRISNVEDMFRHIDLTDVPRAYNGTAVAPPVAAAPPRKGDQGASYPDSDTNGKYFVFIHGFNVDGQRARGWNAEVFKRLYQMGSHARYVGVTWNGATGIRLPNGSYTDYHKAVFHAFQTGDELATRLSSNGVTGDVTIAAHSLGNMLVSQAIQYGGFLPTRYYMINAAVPVEAYDLESVGAGDLATMTNVDWKNPPFSNGSGRLFAANWYLFFPSTGDHRRELTWKQRFSNVVPVAYDFYSPGDDVVEDPVSSSPSLLFMVINQGFSSSHGAWGLQELAKGTFSIASAFFSRTQAGWGESGYWFSKPLDVYPSVEALKIHPFFDSSSIESDLLNPDPAVASAKAGLTNVQYDLLARGIPSLSFATAVHKLIPLDSTGRNYNMEADGRTQDLWPTDGHSGNDVGRWLHSDFKNVPLPYVHQMYQAMIERGSLQ